MMVRERLTGLAPPAAAKKLVDLWRPLIEERAGRDLDRLETWSRTSASSATPCTTCSMRSKWATTAAAIPRTKRKKARRTSASSSPARKARPPNRDDTQRMSTEDTQVSAEDMPDSAAEAVEAPSADMADDTDMGDAETPGEPQRPRQFGANEPRGPDYRAFTLRSTRPSRPRICASRRNSTGCAAISTSSCSHLQGVVARLANRLQRRLMAQQNRSWEFDLEEGHARSGAAVAHRHRSACSRSRSSREGHRIPRHRGDAAARQFRLDARSADHRRRNLRRHFGAHAGALRRQGRDPRLHHARLEGRAVARSLAHRRQAAQSGPAQRPAPHHLQVGRRAVAARTQEPRLDDARGPAEGEHRRRSARLGA